MRSIFLSAVVPALGLLMLASPASAQTPKWSPPPSDALATELFKLGRDKKTHFVETTTKATWGRGEIFVDAPIAYVRAAVLDFGNWPASIPRFEKVKVLGIDGKGATEVYLQMPILKGAAKIWTVQRFDPPAVDVAGEKVVGHFVKGNVDDLRATWRYRPIDAAHTILTLEIYVDPKMDVNEALLTTQLEDAGGEGCLGIRDRSVAAVKAVNAAKKKP